MPRKRSLDVRLVEMQGKMDRLHLEKAISDLKSRMPKRKKRPRHPFGIKNFLPAGF